MEPQHQRNLFSTYVTLQQLVEEVRSIAARGLSPANAAGQMTPLPAAEREKLDAELDALVAEVRSLVERHAPALLAEHERPRRVGHTRAWIDVLLGRVEGLVEELEPERLAKKYGALETADVDELTPRVTSLRNRLSRLRHPGGTPRRQS
jgi:hypothetical protein